MKKNIAVLPIIALLLIAIPGVALAAQTSFTVSVISGSASAETSFLASSSALPYNASSYAFELSALDADVFKMSHMADTDADAVDVVQAVEYSPAPFGLNHISIAEKVASSQIVEADNVGSCCDVSAGTSVRAHLLNYKSAAALDNNHVSFSLNSAGAGKLGVSTTENIISGDPEGTWHSSYYTDQVSVNGIFDLSAEFMSEGCLHPATSLQQDILYLFHP